MSIRVEVAAPTVAIAGDRALSIAGFVGLLIAMAIGGWGVQWDIRWHLLIGRDSFWIAPHVMTYAGVTLSAAIAFGMLALERVRGRASQGWRLAAVGMALTILAAPIDDLWHRLFGIDVTVWSPPHLLGLAGAHLNLLGAMLVAVELWRDRAGGERSACWSPGRCCSARVTSRSIPACRRRFVAVAPSSSRGRCSEPSASRSS